MSVLLLHGFTGHPSDLLPLKDALEAQGYACEMPALPGHGTQIEDLRSIKFSQWVDSARSYQSDVIIGLSMGALLAILVAATRPVSKLILLSPAFYLQPPARLLVWAAQLGLWRLLPSLPKTAGSDIADPVARANSKAYKAIPLRALCEFDALRQRALEALPHVSCPTFSFFGAKDHTVDIKKASALVRDPVIFERSAHILPLDYDQKELISQCLKILEK